MIDLNDIDDTDFFEFMDELRALAIEIYPTPERMFIMKYYDVMYENELRPGIDIMVVPENSTMYKHRSLIPREVRSRIRFSDTMKAGTFLAMRAQ
jgi:hypothetical protein